MSKNILFVGRGFPSCGHVSTCWSISRYLAQRSIADIKHLSYGHGAKFLEQFGAELLTVPPPASTIHQTNRTFPGLELFEIRDSFSGIFIKWKPDLIVCDGELYLPLFCNLEKIKCISIVSPNYINLNMPPYS